MTNTNTKIKKLINIPKVAVMTVLALIITVTVITCIVHFSTQGAVSNVFGTLFGVFAGITAVSVLAVATMAIYFVCRKKWAYSKFFVEFATMAVVFLLCVTIKLITGIVLYAKLGESDFASTTSVEEGLMIVFSSFYEGVGKLAFEGIEPLGHIWASIAYYGASLYAGLMFLGIISAKASYEGYSYMRMSFTLKKKRNIYVFTALTDETLQFAKSIKNDNAIIVFAGHALDPFDRHDDLCREAMANGFLYMSYSNNQKTIADILHLNNHNFENYERNFMVFAFEANKHIPEEEANMDVVFSDIEKRIERGDDGLRIEYYILTKRGINYQAYQSKTKELVDDFKKHNPKFAGNAQNEFSKRFVIEVYNEANTVAGYAVDKVLDAGLREHLVANGGSGVHVWSLGFGGTAEAIVKTLFVQTANVDGNGYSRPYSVEVFDKLISGAKSASRASIDGIFRFAHPDYIFADCEDSREYNDCVKAIYRDKFNVKLQKVHKVSDDDIKRQAENCISLQKNVNELKQNGIQNNWDIIAESKQLIVQADEQIAQEDKNLRKAKTKAKKKIYVDQKEQAEKKKTLAENNKASALQKLQEYYGYQLQQAEIYRDLIENLFINVALTDLNTIVNVAIDAYLKGEAVNVDEKYVQSVIDALDKIMSKVSDANLPKDSDIICAIIKEYILSLAEVNYPHPIYKFNACDCMSRSFYDTVDSVTNDGNLNPNEGAEPDVIVIATGDDYQNVRIANALIQNAVNNKESNKNQYIVVNVFNKQNKDLINSFGANWNSQDSNMLVVSTKNGSITLIVVGNYEDTHDFNALIKLKNEASWQNYTYNTSLNCINSSDYISHYLFTAGNNDDGAEFVNEIKRFANEAKYVISQSRRVKEVSTKRVKGVKQEQPKSIENSNSSSNPQVLLQKRQESLQMFDALDLWKKESNKSVVSFAKSYQAMLKKAGCGDEALKKYALSVFAVEHDRWTRLHVTDGWVYSPSSIKEQKQHNCMKDVRHIGGINTLVYDFMNAIWAVSELVNTSENNGQGNNN